jgi:hypothetical protein
VSIYVEDSVRVSDPQRFIDACKRWESEMQQAGARNMHIYQSESDSTLMLVAAEYDSHSAYHALTEEFGDRFQADAGTEGLQWETRTWKPV